MRRLRVVAPGRSLACWRRGVRAEDGRPLPVVTAPQFPDFVAPDRAAELSPAAGGRGRHDRGWRSCRPATCGAPSASSRRRCRLRRRSIRPRPACGYVELAREDAEARRWRTSIARSTRRGRLRLGARRPRAGAARRSNRDGEALAAFEARAGRRSVADRRARGGRGAAGSAALEQRSGRRAPGGAARAGATRRSQPITPRSRARPTARSSIASWPASSGRRGDADAALEHFRKAVELDPADAASLGADRRDPRSARRSRRRAASRTTTRWRSSRARRRRRGATRCARGSSWRGCPTEYRAHRRGAADHARRSGGAHRRPARRRCCERRPRRRRASSPTCAATGRRTWIMAVARAGVMEPFANHTFQPRDVVRRVDLAQAVSAAAGRASRRRPRTGAVARRRAVRFTDLPAGHLAYPAASVGGGVRRA